jgi:Calx-beta domain/FG-GAP-like repeat
MKTKATPTLRSVRPRPTSQLTRRRFHQQAIRRACAETLEDRRLLSFGPAASYPVGINPQAVTTADLNRDGRADLVTANAYGNTVSALLGNADGTFQSAQNYATGAGPRSLAVGDLNGDGNADVVVTIGTDITAGGSLSVLLGNGNGTFQPAQSIALPGQFPANYDGSTPVPQYPTSVAVGDVNADGKMDLVATGTVTVSSGTGYYGGNYYEYHGYVNVLLGSGNGAFSDAKVASDGAGTANFSETPQAVALGDFNGDGKPDVVAAGSGAVVMLGNGDGTLGSPLASGFGSPGNSIPVADFNQDGKLDILLGNEVFTGRGDGTFASGQSLPGIYNRAVVGDVNADGKIDIVATTSQTRYASYGYYGGYDPTTTDSVTVLLGYGDGSFAPGITSSLASRSGYASSAYGNPVLADFNGDGRPDLAAADSISSVYVLPNDGNWVLAPQPPSISIGDATVTEGDLGSLNAVFTVTLSKASTQTVTVQYATADGSAISGADFTSVTGTLTFAPGETSKTIPVAVTGDQIDEYDENFSVNLSAPTNATIADGTGVGTIVDNDPPPTIVINDVTHAEGNRGYTSFIFTVSLSAPSEKGVSVNYATADGTASTADNDYVAASGTLFFAAGQSSQTITILVFGDKKKEADETFFLNLSGANNGILADSQGIGTILNDDTSPGTGGSHGSSKK